MDPSVTMLLNHTAKTFHLSPASLFGPRHENPQNPYSKSIGSLSFSIFCLLFTESVLWLQQSDLCFMTELTVYIAVLVKRLMPHSFKLLFGPLNILQCFQKWSMTYCHKFFWGLVLFQIFAVLLFIPHADYTSTWFYFLRFQIHDGTCLFLAFGSSSCDLKTSYLISLKCSFCK